MKDKLQKKGEKMELNREDNTIRIDLKEEVFKEIMEILELNEEWPIVPIALEAFYNAAKAHECEPKLRESCLLTRDEKKGVRVFDIEQLKIQAKKMEIKGS